MKNVMNKLRHQHFYCYIAARAEVKDIISDIKEEMYDGIIINLNDRNNNRSYSEKKRIIRRCAEKRTAQSVHKHIGRREGRFPKYQLEHNVGAIISSLNRYQQCC